MPVLIAREAAVAPFDTRTAALEQIGTLTGDLLEMVTGRRIQRLDRVRGLLQRGEALRTQRPESMTVLGAGAARGGALQIERRDHVVEHRLLDRRCQVQRLHPGVDHHEEEGQRGHEAVSQALRLGQMSAEALGQIRFLGDRLQARKQRPQTRL